VKSKLWFLAHSYGKILPSPLQNVLSSAGVVNRCQPDWEDVSSVTFDVPFEKAFQSHKAQAAAIISVSLAISQTPVYIARQWGWCIARCAYTYATDFAGSLLVASTHGGMARLTW